MPDRPKPTHGRLLKKRLEKEPSERHCIRGAYEIISFFGLKGEDARAFRFDEANQLDLCAIRNKNEERVDGEYCYRVDAQ